ncbi:MAG: helix-turn-helix domain-containing protein [Nitrososphaeraceae archaeon]
MDSRLAWLARYHKEGINGLENRPKGGSPSQLPGEVAAVNVRGKLKERNRGWPHSR